MAAEKSSPATTSASLRAFVRRSPFPPRTLTFVSAQLRRESRGAEYATGEQVSSLFASFTPALFFLSIRDYSDKQSHTISDAINREIVCIFFFSLIVTFLCNCARIFLFRFTIFISRYCSRNYAMYVYHHILVSSGHSLQVHPPTYPAVLDCLSFTPKPAPFARYLLHDLVSPLCL